MCLRGAKPAFKQFTHRNACKMSQSIPISSWLWRKFSKKGKQYRTYNYKICMQTWTLAAVEPKSYKVGLKVPKQYNFCKNVRQNFRRIYFMSWEMYYI